jgi:hypothetical protein
MYFVWKADFENEPTYTRAAIENPKALSGIKLTAGQSLMGRLPDLRMEITTDLPPADYFSAGPMFIVSERLRKLLNDAGAVAEYFPIALLKNGVELNAGNYFFANLMEKIDCLDREKSIYTMDGEFVDTINKLAIDENKARQSNLFRLANTFDVITIASQRLVDSILAAGITGVKFLRPTDWKW